MPSTALIFLSAPSGNPSSLAAITPSTTSTLITHVSRTHSPKPLGPYTLDHRLLVDTSSLLPGHTAQRRQTHVLTLPSHFPGKTFVGTSAPASTAKPEALTNGSGPKVPIHSTEYTLMTLPSQPDTLFPLLMQKMSALWVPRQAHRIEGSASFEIGDWKVRIGELRISGGQGQGRVRGCVCEIEFLGGDEDGDEEEIEGISKAFFDDLIEGTGVDLGGMKVICGVAGKEDRLVRQYMHLLKFERA